MACEPQLPREKCSGKVDLDHCQVENLKFEDFLKSPTILDSWINKVWVNVKENESFSDFDPCPLQPFLSLHAGVGSSKMNRDRLAALAASIRSPQQALVIQPDLVAQAEGPNSSDVTVMSQCGRVVVYSLS